MPGLEIEDCGMCIFCRDKPKFGGPGTKRQKCELKELAPAPDAETAAPYVFATMHMISNTDHTHMLKLAAMPAPPALKEAMAKGPLPLVWAFRRKRRARALDPAYVLKYHCEQCTDMEFDRTQLEESHRRYFSRAGPAPEGSRPRSRPRSISTASSRAIPCASASMSAVPIQAAGWAATPAHLASVCAETMPFATVQMMPTYAPVQHMSHATPQPILQAAQTMQPPQQSHLHQQPVPPQQRRQMNRYQMEADSWIADPSESKPAVEIKPRKQRREPQRSRQQHPATSDPSGNAAAMSNKTLDEMLTKLEGQLPAHTYTRVIELVRQVQTGALKLSRQDFLRRFQDICAGASSPRGR